jgi:hypothetical protein
VCQCASASVFESEHESACESRSTLLTFQQQQQRFREHFVTKNKKQKGFLDIDDSESLHHFSAFRNIVERNTFTLLAHSHPLTLLLAHSHTTRALSHCRTHSHTGRTTCALSHWRTTGALSH